MGEENGANSIDSGIDAEREAWFQDRIIEGRQGEVLSWLESAGDFSSWTDRRGRTMTARALAIAGDDRGSTLRHLRNFRNHPDDPIALFFGIFSFEHRFGPLAAMERLQEKLTGFGDRAREEMAFSGMWAFLAMMQAHFRDFSRAHESIDRARQLEPEDMWIEVQRSLLLLREDRPDESREVAEAALEKTPRYWPTIAAVTDRYWMENRDDEAIELLQKALVETQGAGPARKLAQFYDEREMWGEALEVLEEFEKRSPRADEETRKWLAGCRASFLYQLGRGEEMIPHAEIADRRYYHEVVERVKSGEFAKGKRVRLNVRFVRQNELTCAPATLTALSQFFGKEADHLGVAEEICYDGTPDFKERLWAEQQGWVVREFAADWETTKRVIDAGFPFALATVEPTSAHLQSVIGYDSRAGTIIIRDPGYRHYQETLQEPFFEDYAHCGPRAMVLIPPEREGDLAEVELPDEKEYELIYRINEALESHERDAAAELLQELEARSPGHRLVDHGRLVLSAYDQDPRGGYEAAEALAKRFPDSKRWELVFYRKRLHRISRQQRIDYLREQVGGESVFTYYYKELADVLAEDARLLDEAHYYYRRAVKFRRGDADVYYGLAGVLWSQREFTQATFLYRLAATLADKDEGNAESYFKACRWVSETEPALEMLRERFDRLGASSSGPALTLCRALRALDREPEIVVVLEKALELRPDDGDLISFAANHFAGIRQTERATELLEQSVGRISEADRLRLAARLAQLESKPEESIAAWRSLLERDPLAMDAHRSLANLLARSTGETTESIAHLTAACEAFPFHVPLHETLIGWLRDEEPGRAEPVLRRLLEHHETNAWAWRELALDLGDQQRFDDGLEAAKRAAELQPELTWSHSIQGFLHERKHELAEAATAYRTALQLDVENRAAMNGLVRVSDGGEAKREALRFIEEQLASQVLFGEAMHSFRDTAFPILEPEELLASLQRANEARPDLWETWSALIDQYVEMGKLDKALEAATEQSERFPMMPRAWLDLANVHRRRGEAEKRREMLEKCVALNPQWTRALRDLADVVEQAGEYELAVELLERAVREDPHEAPNHGCLADLLWKMERRDEAFAAVLRAVRLDPDYGWGWDTMADWARLLDREKEAIQEGERLVESMPMRWISWQRLALLHGRFDRFEERIATFDRGIEKLPLSADLRQQKAWALCNAGRYDLALAECSEAHWPEGQRPRVLAGREAWIENEIGRREVAIEKMKAVAEHHPDYYWAHEQLAEWYQVDEQWGDALKHARHLVRLAPTEPTSHGMLADLYQKKGDKKRARREFEAAYQIDANYFFAGYHLARLHVESGAFDEAEAVLNSLEFHHSHSPNTVELRCRLECGRKDARKAEEAFAFLCRMPDVAEALLERVELDLIEAGLKKRILPIYEQALESGEVESSAVGRRWAVREVTRRSTTRPIEKFLSQTQLSDEVAEGCWQALLYELEEKKRFSQAKSLIRRNAESFSANVNLWGSVGYVLRTAKKFREVEKWMADYRDREGVMPWMLINLGFAKLQVGGIDAAGPVHQFAATELPEDHDTWCHHAAAAYFEASRGIPSAARAHLAKAEMAELASIYEAIQALAEFMATLREEEKADGELFRKAVTALPDWAQSKSARIYFFDCIRRARSDLYFRSGAGWFAFFEWLKGVCQTPAN